MSVPDKAMKLKDGKIIADQLSSMIAVQFVQATANAAGSYVVYNGEVFYLPDGHTAGTTWANTTKEGPTNIGEINTQLKNAIQGVNDIDNLLIGELPGTTQTVTFDADDNPATITHSKNGSTVRTDVFTWGTDTVTEVRTAYGKYITITTDLTTLQSVISEVQEVA